MPKTAPSLGRIAAMVLFALSCFGLLLFLWVAFGGPVPLKPQGYRFTTSFGEATQLALEADVRISGVPVGTVKSITADNQTGRSQVEIELQSRYAPLPSDARAMLRQKTLLGETYVELAPGTSAAPPVPEDGSLAAGQVGETVELDEIFRSFDAPTREAFQTWMQAQAQAIGDTGPDVNDALGNLAPFAEDAGELVDVLNRQEGAVQQLVRDTGAVFEALTERQGQLRGLIENTNTVFATTASRDEELREIFRALPTFERESRATLRRLDEFAADTDPLVTQLRPAARQLSPTLRDLSALAPDLRALFEGLGPLIDASVKGFPAARRVLRELRPVLTQLEPALRALNPPLDGLALYKRELTAFLGNTAGATQAFKLVDGEELHYLRTTNPFNAENIASYPRRVGSNRTNPYMLPGGYTQLQSAGSLQSYETRHCERTASPVIVGAQAPPTVNGVPQPVDPSVQVDPVLGALSNPQFLGQVQAQAFPNGAHQPAPAPPCRQQAMFPTLPFSGRLVQYPHVLEAMRGQYLPRPAAE